MSRSEAIPPPIPEKFKPLTEIKPGPITSRLPGKFARTNAALIAGLKKRQTLKGLRA